jgi:hypothetical protein
VRGVVLRYLLSFSEELREQLPLSLSFSQEHLHFCPRPLHHFTLSSPRRRTSPRNRYESCFLFHPLSVAQTFSESHRAPAHTQLEPTAFVCLCFFARTAPHRTAQLHCTATSSPMSLVIPDAIDVLPEATPRLCRNLFSAAFAD